MSMRAMTAMARRNPVTNRVLWITGLAVGAAALIGGVAYAATRPSGGGGAGPTPSPTPGPTTPTSTPTGAPTPAPTAGPPNTLPSTLKHGERYLVMLSGPPTVINAPTLANQTAAQQFLDTVVPGEFNVVSVTIGGSTASMIVDVVGPDYTPSATAVAGVQTLQAMGASFTITDTGPTP